jgi:hypothetical protein
MFIPSQLFHRHHNQCLFAVLVTNLAVGDMKVKNFTSKIAFGECPVPFCYTLIHVPYTVTVENLNLLVRTAIAPVQLYDPPQNVILSGSLPTTSGVPVTFHTRLSRHMEPNDKMVLLVRPIYANDTEALRESPMDVILNYVNPFN